mmetsp:Transcript_40962/g.104173  ORF Transcript_40962/g.104173 Transcript_40962/m.104173 type:complete len:208 (+) Transcript_40962:17-640(+)
MKYLERANHFQLDAEEVIQVVDVVDHGCYIVFTFELSNWRVNVLLAVPPRFELEAALHHDACFFPIQRQSASINDLFDFVLQLALHMLLQCPEDETHLEALVWRVLNVRNALGLWHATLAQSAGNEIEFGLVYTTDPLVHGLIPAALLRWAKISDLNENVVGLSHLKHIFQDWANFTQVGQARAGFVVWEFFFRELHRSAQLRNVGF